MRSQHPFFVFNLCERRQLHRELLHTHAQRTREIASVTKEYTRYEALPGLTVENATSVCVAVGENDSRCCANNVDRLATAVGCLHGSAKGIMHD